MIAAIDWVMLGAGGAAALGLCLSALCSGFETGMYSLHPIRLRMRLADASDGAARLVQRLVERREETLVGLLVGNNIAHYTITAALVTLLARSQLSQHQLELLTTALVAPFLFVFGEMVPKGLFRGAADRIVYRAAPFVRTLMAVLRACGLIWLVRGIVAIPARLFRSATTSEVLGSRDAVRAMLLETAATGVLTPFQAEVADNVLEVASVTLRNIMVPHGRVVMISENYRRDELVQLARHFTYSSVPVYAVGDRQRIVGLLRIDEGLFAPATDWSVAKLMRPAMFLSVTTPVLRALTALREQRQVMGIVTDAAGRALGIVTMKDLVEEITGELAAW